MEFYGTQVPSLGELLRLFNRCKSIRRRFDEDRLIGIDQNPNDSFHTWASGDSHHHGSTSNESYYVLCRIQYFGPTLFVLTVSGIQTLLENPQVP